MRSRTRPFRFGVNLFAVTDREQWLETARTVEQLDYDVLLVPDHLGYVSPLPALVAAAGVTNRVRLGTFVLNAGLYNPTILARDVATADLVTGGRLELGLGTGYVKSEFESSGIPFGSPGARINHLTDTVATVYGLLADDAFTPRPAQTRIPLMLAGNGDRMLRLAATHADIIGFTGASTDRDGNMSLNNAADVESRVQFAREAAGEVADDIEWNLLVQRVVVTDDVQRVTAELHSEYAPELSSADFSALPSILVGTVEQIAEKLTSLRERTGISYVTVLESALRTFAPVIEVLRNC